MKKNKKYFNGFTMLEVIITALLVGTIVSGILLVFTGLSRHQLKSRYRTEALELAQNYAERLKAANQIGSPLLRDTTFTQDRYTIFAKIKPDTPQAGVYGVNLKVQWLEKNTPKSINYNFNILVK